MSAWGVRLGAVPALIIVAGNLSGFGGLVFKGHAVGSSIAEKILSDQIAFDASALIATLGLFAIISKAVYEISSSRGVQPE